MIEALPSDAGCAGRGSFIAAEALLALGLTDDAADRYATLTTDLMSPAKQPLAQRLEQWADRVLEEEGSASWAASLLLPAAQLESEPARRLALARRIAKLGPSGPAKDFAVTVLSDSIRENESGLDGRGP